MTASDSRCVLVLGASGLIGNFVSVDLLQRGYKVIAVARRFTRAQRLHLNANGREMSVVDLPVAALAELFRESAADVIVNCLGLLQDGAGGRTHDVHDGFIDKLIQALRSIDHAVQLVHISIPGDESQDKTDFSRTKRNADRRLIASNVPCTILRPGFVFAPRAFGGSALLRALAAMPVALPPFESSRTFRYVAIENVAETVNLLVRSWDPQRPGHAVVWDVMHPQRQTVSDIVAILRRWLGAASERTIGIPSFLLDLAGKAGDLVAYLGWSPPIRSTALTELRRGVDGDPAAWLAATGIAPHTLADVLAARPASVQEKWFARLYLLKAVILASLVVFWCASALIALTVAYDAAVEILISRGFPLWLAQAITIGGGMIDFLVGVAIAFRRTSRVGLFAGIAVSLFYMIAAGILTPDLWIEPLGALVKTFPAIVLMLVALAISNDR
jgi:uncharacterized protein YbjT (DUF2867 family)